MKQVIVKRFGTYINKVEYSNTAVNKFIVANVQPLKKSQDVLPDLADWEDALDTEKLLAIATQRGYTFMVEGGNVPFSPIRGLA